MPPCQAVPDPDCPGGIHGFFLAELLETEVVAQRIPLRLEP
jgi:hypothetical protein